MIFCAEIFLLYSEWREKAFWRSLHELDRIDYFGTFVLSGVSGLLRRGQQGVRGELRRARSGESSCCESFRLG